MKNLILFIALGLLFSCAKKNHYHTKSSQGNTQSETVEHKEGQVVHVNQKAYNVETTLNALLNRILPDYEGKRVLVELNTTEYQVDGSIILPSSRLSSVVIRGNHATINNTISGEDFVFYKPPNYDYGTTGIADTYQEISDLWINGTGSGIKLVGGYQSKVRNVQLTYCPKGIVFEFVLQGLIQDCVVGHPSSVGISVSTIDGKGVNKTQCNGTLISRNRILAKNTDVGIYIGNSNLVKLEGNIIEGGRINKGIYFHNEASTVKNFNLSRTHFECGETVDACVYFDGAISNFTIEEMYYSGIGGLAIKSGCSHAYSHIFVRNIGWLGKWKIKTSKYNSNGHSVNTWWHFDDVNSSDLSRLFTDIKPLHVYQNGEKYVVKIE